MLIFRHVYDRKRPERYYRDHDNIELNSVVDAVALYFMHDDGPTQCRHYYCMAVDDQERTEVFLVPRSEFDLWLFAGKGFGNIGQKSSSVVACYEEQKPFLQAYFGDCAKFAIVNTEKLESILSIEKRDLISDG